MRKSLWPAAQWVGGSSCTPDDCRFNSQSGHMPRLQVRSLVGVSTGSNQWMFLSLSNQFKIPYPRVKIKKINRENNLRKPWCSGVGMKDGVDQLVAGEVGEYTGG